MSVSAGDYEHVYDPSIGESEPWYINDHTFVPIATACGTIGSRRRAMAAHDEAPHTRPHVARAVDQASVALSADLDAGETHLWAPHVVVHDDRYWMFYCGGGLDETAYRIQLAVSGDCWRWTRHAANPLVVDGFHARDPMVLRVGDRWVLYYTATTAPSGGQFVVKAVESDDLLTWAAPRIVYTDARAGTFGGTTESPFVVARDGLYYLFIGPDWGMNLTSYRTTRVLASDDPFHFEASGRVGTIASHAPRSSSTTEPGGQSLRMEHGRRVSRAAALGPGLIPVSPRPRCPRSDGQAACRPSNPTNGAPPGAKTRRRWRRASSPCRRVPSHADDRLDSSGWRASIRRDTASPGTRTRRRPMRPAQ